MTTRRALLWFAALVSATSLHARPQSAGGSIAGVVVSADSQPQPMRRVVVTLTGGTVTGNLSMVTDDSGQFTFVDLPAGRYHVNASRPAYLPASYGATRPGGPGSSIALASGQKQTIRLTMHRGAVISGTVRDLEGQPIPGLQVNVASMEGLMAASSLLLSSGAVLTDERGVYRAYGLAPGEYLVAVASRTGGGGNEALTRLSLSEVDARMRAVEQRTGVSGGSGQALSPTPQAGQTAAQTMAYAQIYYPGTPFAAEAARIRVTAGEERAGVDIPYVPVRTARVSGVIQGSGEIAVTRIRPTLAGDGPQSPGGLGAATSTVAADGSFAFNNVTPGRYTVLARTGDGAMMQYSEGTRTGATSSNPGMVSLMAAAEVSVDGRDVGGLVLMLRPAPSLAGRIVYDGTAKPPETPVRVAFTAISSSPLRDLLGMNTAPSTTSTPDGSFKLTGLVPGTYGMNVTGAMLGTTWWVRSVVVDGRDLLDRPIEITPQTGELAGAVITLSDRRSELSGRLISSAGQPVTEYAVVVFAVDQSLWRVGARRAKSARPGTDGAFSISELPAGEYYLAAMPDTDPKEWQQPAFLEQIVGAAIKVTIGEGQKVTQDLKIAR